jgi:hypothetical protein
VTTNRQRRQRGQVWDRAKRATPKPALLTWCLRQVLYHAMGWKPYY